MKFFLTALFFQIIASSNIFASAPTKAWPVATYRFAVFISQEQNHLPGAAYETYVSSLYEDGRLMVKKVTPLGQGNSNEELLVKNVILSAPLITALKADVAVLASAPLKEITRTMICRLMPTPEMGVSYLNVARKSSSDNQDTNPLSPVDTATGCWMAKEIHPKNEMAKESALRLKQSLKVLAL